MSFSNPTKSTNPAKKFIQYHGNTGKWTWYDKEVELDQEIQLPFYFVILDDLFTIKGFSDSFESYIYSNEVHNTNELLKVKSFKGGLSVIGYYPDIKLDLKDKGGKYHKSIYALAFDKDYNTELVNISIGGVALGPWIELKVKMNSQSVAIMPEVTDGRKGTVEFKIPSFKTFKIPEEMIEKATETDKELQEYFKQYKAVKEVDNAEKEIVIDENLSQKADVKREEFVNEQAEEEFPPQEELDDLPF